MAGRYLEPHLRLLFSDGAVADSGTGACIAGKNVNNKKTKTLFGK